MSAQVIVHLVYSVVARLGGKRHVTGQPHSSGARSRRVTQRGQILPIAAILMFIAVPCVVWLWNTAMLAQGARDTMNVAIHAAGLSALDQVTTDPVAATATARTYAADNLQTPSGGVVTLLAHTSDAAVLSSSGTASNTVDGLDVEVLNPGATSAWLNDATSSPAPCTGSSGGSGYISELNGVCYTAPTIVLRMRLDACQLGGFVTIEQTDAFTQGLGSGSGVTVEINDGAPYTNTPAVTLDVNAGDASGGVSPTEMRASNDGATWSNWVSLSGSMPWTLSGNDGPKTVYVQVGDGTAAFSTAQTSIILDTMPPVATINPLSPQEPGTFTLTATATDATSGITTIDLYASSTPGAATSTYEDVGSSESGTFTISATVGAQISFYVIAKDGAGNISATPTVPQATVTIQP